MNIQDNCLDLFGWTNGRGKTCADYSQWCDNGQFKVGASWAGGETFNFPEQHCCLCGGRGSAASPPPPPPSDGLSAHKYDIHRGFTCRNADRLAKYTDPEGCEAHCASRKCACTHFGNGKCRFTYTYTGIVHSGDSYTTWSKHRVADGESAGLYVVPAFGSLSEATGTCEGTSHLERMAAAAKALGALPWVGRAPKQHMVFAGATSQDRTPLGELGALLSSKGAIGVCPIRSYCSARFTKRAEIPMLPLLLLMDKGNNPRLTSEACPYGPSSSSTKRRSTLLYFRGAHGTGEQAQEIRARLWELRTLPGADIKFSQGGPDSLLPQVRNRLKSLGWSGRDVRMPFNAQATAHGMLHSDFCAIPRGEVATATGRRIIDAVAAGCVPLLLGDALRPPLSSFLKWSDFSVRVPEGEFLHYPKKAVEDALAAAGPKLAELRRNLLRARDELLLGYGDAPTSNPANFTPAKGAALVLLKAGSAFCPRSPATFRTCTEGMV